MYTWLCHSRINVSASKIFSVLISPSPKSSFYKLDPYPPKCLEPHWSQYIITRFYIMFRSVSIEETNWSLSIFGVFAAPNAEKYRPEKLQIGTLFMQWVLDVNDADSYHHCRPFTRPQISAPNSPNLIDCSIYFPHNVAIDIFVKQVSL